MVRYEMEVLQSITEKLHIRFSNLMNVIIEEFEVELELNFEENKDYFTGWFFCEYTLNDGKTIPQLIKQTMILDEKEQELIRNIENVVIGYFVFVSKKNNIITLRDILTKIKYNIEVIDLDYKFNENDLIGAKLVKNFEGKLFFFGTFGLRTKDKESVYNMINEYLGVFN